VVAPLAHPDLADRLELTPPAAIMLFGPPGTGKTSFARSIASRLSWAFVELHPSLLGQGAAGAAALRQTLDELRRVDRIVCFIDEADEIASDRAERPDNQPIVNELLKAIPTFKSRPGRLMVMATNSIAAIDLALLRPGRLISSSPSPLPTRGGVPSWPSISCPPATRRRSRRAPTASPPPTSPWSPNEARSWPSTGRSPAARAGHPRGHLRRHRVDTAFGQPRGRGAGGGRGPHLRQALIGGSDPGRGLDRLGVGPVPVLSSSPAGLGRKSGIAPRLCTSLASSPRAWRHCEASVSMVPMATGWASTLRRSLRAALSDAPVEMTSSTTPTRLPATAATAHGRRADAAGPR